ncbi:MAG: hypothetical protein R3213_06935, partial [Flavobacteriaceae bacterium]|nr:hypothetical protein [Flavobacteriaceae bacterium]
MLNDFEKMFLEVLHEYGVLYEEHWRHAYALINGDKRLKNTWTDRAAIVNRLIDKGLIKFDAGSQYSEDSHGCKTLISMKPHYIAITDPAEIVKSRLKRRRD